jgi:NDP-sugar pyrophosphorylase family protein
MTRRIPKPMLPVAGKPLLEHRIVSLKRWGVRRVVLASAHRSEVIAGHFGNGAHWGLEILHSDPGEGRQLGTAGSIKAAETLLREEDFFAMNGDILFEPDLGRLYDTHRGRHAAATLALARVENPSRYGLVELSAEGRIEAFMEKGQPSAGRAQWINGGLYLFNRSILGLMEGGRHYSLEHDIFPGLAGKTLWGVGFEGVEFLDIGTPEDYQKASKAPSSKSI